MTREEMKEVLTQAGIAFDGRWADDKLQSLILAETPIIPEEETKTKEDEMVQNALAALKNLPPFDAQLDRIQARNRDGVITTPSGIIIPPEVMVGHSKTNWVYDTHCTETVCEVFRMAYTGYRELVRTYERDVHGDNFKELATSFINKNNF